MNTKTDGVAIASLVLSCMSVAIGPFGFIPGIICGHIARSRIRQNPAMGGDGLALAGLIIGYLFLLIMLAVLILYF